MRTLESIRERGIIPERVPKLVDRISAHFYRFFKVFIARASQPSKVERICDSGILVDDPRNFYFQSCCPTAKVFEWQVLRGSHVDLPLIDLVGSVSVVCNFVYQLFGYLSQFW